MELWDPKRAEIEPHVPFVGKPHQASLLRESGSAWRLTLREGLCYVKSMLELTGGEWFLVAFITIAVVSAPLWPRAGEFLGSLLDPATPNPRKSNENSVSS